MTPDSIFNPCSSANSLERGITVSVVSHDQRAMVAALIEQIAGLQNPDIVRVVLVHNLPDEDLPKPPSAAFDFLQRHNARPFGFAENHNLAFAHCSTPWFAVLNPDIEFSYGDPFFPLINAVITDPKIGAIAPTLLQPETLHAEPLRGVVTPFEIIFRRLPGWKPPLEPAWLVGAFLLLRSDAFRQLRGFDAGYRMYCEDVDLGMRMRDVGWNIRRAHDARVVHLTQRKSHRSFLYTWMHIMSLLRLWSKIINQRAHRAMQKLK